LTATHVEPPWFRVDVARETLRRTTLDHVRSGGAVNLELPLRADARLGGHFVQGHVDGVGRVTHAGPRDGNWVLAIDHDAGSAPLVVEKGSIAIDGVSLTITEASGASFAVMLIPHTLEMTTLGRLSAGDGVNLEYDILAKYMANFAEAYYRAGSD
jgi:riboflavin synthase